MTPLVSIRGLRVRLGDNTILDGVNADVARGEVTAVIGLNGAGKTTLLRALIKEIPCEGEVRFHCGHDHSQPFPQSIGYVPQKLNIDARLPLTVRDLLALALQRRPLFLGISRRTTEKMRELVKSVWMDEAILDKPVETFPAVSCNGSF